MKRLSIARGSRVRMNDPNPIVIQGVLVEVAGCETSAGRSLPVQRLNGQPPATEISVPLGNDPRLAELRVGESYEIEGMVVSRLRKFNEISNEDKSDESPAVRFILVETFVPLGIKPIALIVS